MWAAGVVMAVSVAAWVVSMFRFEWNSHRRDVGIKLWRGLLGVHNDLSDEELSGHRFHGLRGGPLWWPKTPPGWYEAFDVAGLPRIWMVSVPL